MISLELEESSSRSKLPLGLGFGFQIELNPNSVHFLRVRESARNESSETGENQLAAGEEERASRICSFSQSLAPKWQRSICLTCEERWVLIRKSKAALLFLRLAPAGSSSWRCCIFTSSKRSAHSLRHAAASSRVKEEPSQRIGCNWIQQRIAIHQLSGSDSDSSIGTGLLGSLRAAPPDRVDCVARQSRRWARQASVDSVSDGMLRQRARDQRDNDGESAAKQIGQLL